MTALAAECAAVLECIACLEAGDVARALVWLRLADEARAEWLAA